MILKRLDTQYIILSMTIKVVFNDVLTFLIGLIYVNLNQKGNGLESLRALRERTDVIRALTRQNDLSNKYNQILPL